MLVLLLYFFVILGPGGNPGSRTWIIRLSWKKSLGNKASFWTPDSPSDFQGDKNKFPDIFLRIDYPGSSHYNN